MNINVKSLFITFFLSFTGLPLLSEITLEQENMLKKLPADQREAIKEKMTTSNEINEEIEEIFSQDSFLVKRPDDDEEENKKKCEECIYGYDLFKFSPSTFAPANIVPVSFSYILGPGDELSVNLYGTQEDNKTGFISRDGTFNVPVIGTVTLAGFTFAEAQKFLSKRINEELIGTKISINLKKLRSITVYVLGEAYKPGSYTLSALSSVTNSLFLSGGVNKLGSLRNIEIKRRGKLLKKYDLYDLLVKGDTSTDVRLEDGDTIFIPFIENKVTLGGDFKRPYLYEILEGETLEEVISLAGGFKSGVSLIPRIEYSTINRLLNKREISYITYNKDVSNKKILNGDALYVAEHSGLKPRSIELTGEFQNPGVYSISEGDTILAVVMRAGGYTNSAFVEGAVFLRKEVAKQEKLAFERSANELEELLARGGQNIRTNNENIQISEFALGPAYKLVERLREVEPVGRVVVSLDTLELKTNPFSNFELRDEDRIYIPKRPTSITVVGEVLKAASLQFVPGSSIEDYLNSSGGLNYEADKDRIFVISPNGQAEVYKRRFMAGGQGPDMIPGSTIVVSRSNRSWDAIQLTTVISPILSNLATSIAAIAVISKD